MILCCNEINNNRSTGHWVPAIATTVTYELIKFEYKDNNEKREEWLEIESDRIMPIETMSKNLKQNIMNEIDL